MLWGPTTNVYKTIFYNLEKPHMLYLASLVIIEVSISSNFTLKLISFQPIKTWRKKCVDHEQQTSVKVELVIASQLHRQPEPEPSS